MPQQEVWNVWVSWKNMLWNPTRCADFSCTFRLCFVSAICKKKTMKRCNCVKIIKSVSFLHEVNIFLIRTAGMPFNTVCAVQKWQCFFHCQDSNCVHCVRLLHIKFYYYFKIFIDEFDGSSRWDTGLGFHGIQNRPYEHESSNKQSIINGNKLPI